MIRRMPALHGHLSDHQQSPRRASIIPGGMYAGNEFLPPVCALVEEIILMVSTPPPEIREDFRRAQHALFASKNPTGFFDALKDARIARASFSLIAAASDSRNPLCGVKGNPLLRGAGRSPAVSSDALFPTPFFRGFA